MVKIKFLNGEMITADLNGSCYIVNNKPEFPSDLSLVIVEGTGDENKEFHNAELIECASIDGRYWFSFKEVTDDEQLRADVDYLLCIID